MPTKTTGAEYKAYLEEKDPQWWPENAYMDDEVLTVNGKSNENDFSFDSSKLEDSDVVVIECGSYFKDLVSESTSLEAHFKRWRKAQNTAWCSFECPKDKLDAVKAAIKAAGGKVA